ncbi:MAG: ADP-ribosylation factor-like protein [Candidatus Helarchaeota archaeon]
MEQYKIVFAGLANAGKTSMTLTLKRQFSDLSGIKPTMGIERTEMDILGFKIVNWDLGGQERYREEYKKKEAVIFSETEIFFYVIDIQDPDSYDDALQYLNEIAEIYRLVDPENLPIVAICFNKLDPNLLVDYSKNVEELTTNIVKILNGFEYQTFKTSIYNLPSLIEAFSWGISKFLPKQSELELVLRKFLKEHTNVNAVNLLEKHSMFLIQSYRDENAQRFYNLLKEGIISIVEKLGNQLNIFTFDINGVFKLYVERMTILRREYYFIFMGQDLNFDQIQKSLLNTYYGQIQDIIKQEIS